MANKDGDEVFDEIVNKIKNGDYVLIKKFINMYREFYLGYMGEIEIMYRIERLPIFIKI
ncbi:hypothetical protein [Clostridium chromiireducens]|uniref:hypothetical protein n=1 Tax=Clostridium chromiireducens TaxID=225345 RepID=UPI00311A9BCA